MDAATVVRILRALRTARIDAWLDGGWAIDALVGHETRPHLDLDLVIARDDVLRVRSIADGLGLSSVTNLETARADVDLHPVAFDGHGDGWQEQAEGRAWPYPASGFSGRGVVAGHDVHCLTAVTQVLRHHGYEPDSDDLTDLRVLAGATGVSLAPPYGVAGTDLVVRPARPTDLGAMTLVWADASRTAYRPIFPTGVPPPSLAALLRVWEHSVEHPGCQVFVAASGDQVVGTVLVERNDDGSGDFARLYVHPSRWGSGIGRALYDAALDSLRTSLATEVRLWVLEANRRARDWYEREGWTASGERQEVVAGVEEVRYRLGLGHA